MERAREQEEARTEQESEQAIVIPSMIHLAEDMLTVWLITVISEYSSLQTINS